ncbi:DsbA family oxidoreductase [Halioglobus maricola]|uniref:DsbA family oxidoreductase n=1 Tax=Halioglobus maricola TaxID=2601894 RepID=A0A5P9NID0_9GAMM|nr:DsbA family oxidoreductase [Halioglobus maricola]QFU75583.1 DsbA family oxidoreductase [Halioglobus maricola]
MNPGPKTPNLKIDIVSDVVCPWCIIGYKQLLKALESMSGQFNAEIEWHPFELNPYMPPEGQDLREHVIQKYGTTPEQSKAARARMTELGTELGFTFAYADDMRMVNTFSAHQLLHWARTMQKQTELKLELFAAFFTQREDVSDFTVLSAAAARAGLSEKEALAVLQDGRYAELVREELDTWLDNGVHAVPTFFFNKKFQVPGAQEAETFVRVLERIKASE